MVAPLMRNDVDRRGAVYLAQLNHPTSLPVYKKVHNYEHHPKEGPAIVLLSGGLGASRLSATLTRYTHNSSHVMPVFDDGGSSRELRQKLGMPPPGDIRNRLMALSDQRGDPEVSRLFGARLPSRGEPAQLLQELEGYCREDHPQLKKIERRLRRIIIHHLDHFIKNKPGDFDLCDGSIGNFVIAGAYLSLGNLESVIFEFSALVAALGQVYPVCREGDYHLRADLQDGAHCVGQSRITSRPNPPIQHLSIVTPQGDGFLEVRPRLNLLAEAAIRKSHLIAYSMGSFYTSLISNLLVSGMGHVIRETKRPKVLVANLMSNNETPDMRVSTLLLELLNYLRISDTEFGSMQDYVQYALVGAHQGDGEDGHLPVDLDAIRSLGVEPIVLPLEQESPDGQPVHDMELVASVLLSLC